MKVKILNIVGLLFLVLLVNTAKAQVPKKTIVEHFTNSKCSICASRNPGLNANLNANPQVERISIHPSAPYSTCFLSQQNTIDNDARTNYYNIYGSTPKLLINGTLISTSQNYADAAIFTPFISSTNFNIQIKQFAIGNDSLRSEIIIKRVAMGTPNGNANLFAALVEDTVFGNGGNGENLHFNVMRKSLFLPQGESISLPVNIGDSLVLNKTSVFNSIWNHHRMRTVAILQEELSKQLIQSELSSTEQIVTSASLLEKDINNIIMVYPNPSNRYITVKLPGMNSHTVEIYNTLGKLILSSNFNEQERIDISNLSNGVYLLRAYNECSNLSNTIVVKQ